MLVADDRIEAQSLTQNMSKTQGVVMNAVASPKEATPKVVKTTLFDLISAMQDHATTPVEEALIVPTVMDLLQNGRIRTASDYPLPSVA